MNDNDNRIAPAPTTRIPASRLFPPQRYRDVPWDLLEVSVAIVGFELLLPNLLAAILSLAKVPLEHERSLFAVVIVSGVITVVTVPYFLARRCGAQMYQLGLHCEYGLRNAILGICTYFVVAPLVALVMYLATQVFDPTPHTIEQIIRRSATTENLVLATICAVVIAPAEEELLFRGMLLFWMRRLIGPWYSIIASSLIFAALHSNAWPAPIPLFVLSIFLGYLAHRTSSLVAPVALHATFNGVSMLVLITLVRTHGELPDLQLPPSLTTGVLANSILRALVPGH